MRENSVAKFIKVVASIEVGLGIAGSFVIWDFTDDGTIFIAALLSVVMTFAVMLGFVEVINLLQSNNNKLDVLIDLQNSQPDSRNSTILSDIESNLPNI